MQECVRLALTGFLEELVIQHLYDRALGAAYLNGLWEAIDKNAKKG